MKSSQKRHLLLLISLLASLLVLYEVYLTFNTYPVESKIHNLQPFSIEFLGTANRKPNLRKLLEDRDIQELPVRISTECTREQIRQSYGINDIICVNETQLWSELSRHVKLNQLTESQAKTAIVSAVQEELKSRQNRAKQKYVHESLIRDGYQQRSSIDGHQQDSGVANFSTSFYDHIVASFIKEAQNKPSDFAIPKLDSFYERHLPVENADSGKDYDFDGLLPIGVKKKKVRRPFMPVVVEEKRVDNYDANRGSSFNNKWQNPGIPGIPPMPDRPPSFHEIEHDSKNPLSQENIPHRPPDISPSSRAGPPVLQGSPHEFSHIPPHYAEHESYLPIQEYQEEPVLQLPPESNSILLQNDQAAKHKSSKKKSHQSLLSNDLLQLRGFQFQENFDLILRKLPTRFKYDGVRIKDRLKYIERAMNATDPVVRDMVTMSLNPNILERAKFQQQQMHDFCTKETDLDPHLPSSTDDLNTLFQHLLYDDSRRMVFCYIPKNGCSNMKRMMLILNGILPPESAHEKRPPEAVLKQVHSFRNLTKKEAIYKLKNYYKFAIVRNPLERLLSAYRNKLESPLNYELRRNFPDRLKAYILKKYRREDFEDWIADSSAHNTTDIHPSFPEFLRFMSRFSLNRYNEHFKPVLELCYPCAVHYDLFLNFKTLEYDMFALMQFLDIPLEYYPEAIAHKAAPTENFLVEYFRDVDTELKVKLLRAFRNELEFYYTLYPEEWGMHQDL